jgi:thioesterase domain-containing protein/acyl carrier protein
MSLKHVEDVFPLSPMQEVMLLHALSAPDDTLFNQFCYELRGAIDRGAFRSAWRDLSTRHAAFRTAFVWEDLKQPLQIVRDEVEFPIIELDWSDRSDEQQRADLAAFRESDREAGFTLTEAPLTRLTTIKIADDREWWVWSSHHLILDRWCLSSLYADLLELYAAGANGAPALPPSGRFRDYIAWIQSRPAAETETFWRTALAGFTSPSLLTRRADDPGRTGQERARLRLSGERMAAVRDRAREYRLTPGALVQAAWALAVNGVIGTQDVVFGATVSGRPPDLRGVESTVGSFINNLPVRVRLPADDTIENWLAGVHRAQHARLPHEHVSMVSLRKWCDLAPGDPLFDQLFVWLAPADMASPLGVSIEPAPGELTTAYPLTISVAEEDEGLSIELILDRRWRTMQPMNEIADRFASVLGVLSTAPGETRLRDIDGFRADGEPTSNGTATIDVPRKRAPLADDGAMVARGREAMEDDLMLDLIRDEWKDLLRRSEVEDDANFFDLGGNSLLATELHGRLEVATRLVIPVLSLFQEPTPREMTRTICERDWPLAANIVTPIRTRGTKAPLFCVASPEVNTVGYTLVARHLSEEQPVYVVQTPPRVDAVRRLSPSDLMELAKTYNQEIRSVHPEGPVHLLGMCSGAHISLAMARLLRDGGREVGLVGIVNTWAFFTRSRLYHLELKRRKVGYYASRVWAMMKKRPGSQFGEWREIKQRRLERQAERRVEPPRSDAPRVRSETGNPWIDEVGWESDAANIAAYDGHVTVYRIRKRQVGRVRDRALGWGRHAAGTTVEVLSGDDHHAILREPRVQELAERIEHGLESASERASS